MGTQLVFFTDSSSAVLRNKVMYASANKWCSDITTTTPDYTTRCLAVPGKIP